MRLRLLVYLIVFLILFERYESFFSDYGLVPLLVQQNWPEAVRNSHNKATSLER
jgi:hypothetical protein